MKRFHSYHRNHPHRNHPIALNRLGRHLLHYRHPNLALASSSHRRQHQHSHNDRWSMFLAYLDKHLLVYFRGYHRSHHHRYHSIQLDPLADRQLSQPSHHHPYQDMRSNRLQLSYHTRLDSRQWYQTTYLHRNQYNPQCRVSSFRQWLDSHLLHLRIHHRHHPCLHPSLCIHRHRCPSLSRKPTLGVEENRKCGDKHRRHREHHRYRRPYLRMNRPCNHRCPNPLRRQDR